MMLQTQNIHLARCPHCNVAKPNLSQCSSFQTTDSAGKDRRTWASYYCKTCGGVMLTAAWVETKNPLIHAMWPSIPEVDEAVPGRSKQYLEQAIASIHAPAGAVMLAASCVDAMLKEKGLKDGSLYTRIDKAAAQHLITSEMAAWAHEVRLDANDQRHADDQADLPTTGDAQRCTEFAQALAQFLFVLPSRVERGRAK
ncbi:DUF4145 domain-containing protein [Pseudomonas asiatica]|nr:MULTISPECIES: DUF4145 domain-containing protein [Pseudomonas]MCE0850373.1 DUF4145 domain-containing protein [Pseudomonas asiatica]